MVKSRLSDGESLNIGGYVVRNENNRIITDRSAVIRNHTEICNTFETPGLRETLSGIASHCRTAQCCGWTALRKSRLTLTEI